MTTKDPDNQKFDEGSVFVNQLTACQHRIYAFILTLVPNWSDADDLMQETTEVMWRKFQDEGQINHFCAWGKGIARNKIMNFYAKKKRERVLFDDSLLDDVIEREEKTSLHEELRVQTLKKCLQKLRPNDRYLIQVLYGHEITIKKLAEEVKRPVQGLYKAMARIHHSLLQCVRRSLSTAEDYS
ncbi:MAG: sigma-70 family RNA polymerase sigma factor [Planctomycetes bacterium]|nr:sigma-70 family RNA polymerase sigma factor [Planctomycetota bacterium]